MTVKANPERTRRVTYNDKASLVLTILKFKFMTDYLISIWFRDLPDDTVIDKCLADCDTLRIDHIVLLSSYLLDYSSNVCCPYRRSCVSQDICWTICIAQRKCLQSEE